jgi:hypothetical protein
MIYKALHRKIKIEKKTNPIKLSVKKFLHDEKSLISKISDDEKEF